MLAVVIVTAALCADHAVAAAPSLRPAVGEIASRFVDRLARKLGQSVVCVKLPQTRSENDRPAVFVVASPVVPTGIHAVLAPFQLRLPPPVL
jgi:hypothetical protein